MLQIGALLCLLLLYYATSTGTLLFLTNLLHFAKYHVTTRRRRTTTSFQLLDRDARGEKRGIGRERQNSHYKERGKSLVWWLQM